MSLSSRTQNSIFALLLCSGTLCFGWGFGLIFLSCFAILSLAFPATSSKSIPFPREKSVSASSSAKVPSSDAASPNQAFVKRLRLPAGFIPPRFSRPLLTLLCAGYLPLLAFWGNFTRFTSCPQLTNEEAFWLFNVYTLLLELFLLLSQRSDSVRAFLLLIALEQIVSGFVFRPAAFTMILFLPSLFFLLEALHSAASFASLKQCLQIEMQNTREEMILSFSTYSKHKKLSVETSSSSRLSVPILRKTPVTLGNVGEEDIRNHLKNYPIRLERKKQSLRFVSLLDAVEKIEIWEDAAPHSSLSISLSHSPLRLLTWLGASLAFGVLFFLTVYRQERFTSGNFGWSPPVSIGYSENSRLGDVGPQLSDPAPFFWLRLFADDGSQKWQIPLSDQNLAQAPLASDPAPFEKNGPLYLRGAVFDQYENAGWSSSPTMFGANPTLWTPNSSNSERLHFRNGILKTRGLVRTEEIFEPTVESTFFAVWPSLLPPDRFDFPTKFSIPREKILFASNEPTAGVPYSLLSQGFFLRRESEPPTASDSQSVPSFRFAQSAWSPAPGAEKNPEYSRKPDENRFPSLCRLATKWASELPPETSSLQTALELAERFSLSPRFRYSVSPVKRDRSLDPLEDFIRNHPQGHCEFYAASLVLALRSCGIPARYVVGFVAQEYSPTLGAWVVRRQDAHAWAEAWIPPREIPDEVKANLPISRELWRQGAWLRLDPTSRHAAEIRPTAHGPFFALTSSIEGLWKNYFLNMNSKNQQSWIYEPIGHFLQSASQSGKKLATRFQNRIHLVVALALFMLSAILVRLLFRRFCRASVVSPKSEYYVKNIAAPLENTQNNLLCRLESIRKRREHSVRFFRELENDLLAKGMKRANGETSMEFMEKAEEKLGRNDLKALTQKYYALRFGAKENPDS